MPENKHSRKPRADAERNRLHLLKIARKVFDKKGTAASLEEIARAAGVGIGTLYRHFPTRGVLIDALFSRERDQLVEAAAKLSRERTPLDAIHQWLLLFVNYLANKQIMAEILSNLAGRTERDTSHSEILVETLADLLACAKKSGDLAANVEAMDLLCAVAGVATFGTPEGWEPSAKRLVDLIGIGLQSGRQL
ncbi:AcrR family transcriptional regulator [Haloferula luteola]|uniref:AcrR family transcriptional regulator n=1 Tax=Haloferula luteola TaxID=595692 RepID=A0A840VAV0_9BACT|nr:TetR/AcrR family transcriptional regulator [Haloferula luteola]MBB5350929.1 AcrR family transcriptional regulator [Haloferula luteola]